MTAETARLFLGIELSGEARAALDGVRASYAEQGVQGKFHRPEMYHLTLCFLGSTPKDDIPRICRLMDAVPSAPFTLTLSAPGTFKNGSILWAGVRPCDALTDYQSRLAAALREAGFPLEEAEYRPHITLARQVRSALPDLSVPEIPFPVTHATLFESTRIDGVLSYIPLYRSAFR